MWLAKIAAKLEVKPTDDEYEAIKTTRWGNRDVYPVAHDKRVYGVYDYIAYWVSTFTLWRTNLCWSSLGNMRHVSVVVDDWQQLDWHWPYTWASDGSGGELHPVLRAKHHLGYGMLARSTFGLWGSYFVVMLNVFQSFVFYGTQMYFGGQAFVIILNSLSPSFLHMRNTLPER
jgi:NCS1 family nucleobase:cation symporter-1